MKEPQTLQEAVKYFANPANCRDYLVRRRWPDGVVRCPRCGSEHVKFSEKHNRWQCSSHHDRRQFTLKTGTIFEDSPLGLDKWLMALWMLVNCKNGVSSWEIHRMVGVTQKTAWFILHRLRKILERENDGTKLGSNNGGEVEVDEAFVGPVPRNMHKERRARYNQQRMETGTGRTAVQGILDRDARTIRATIVPDVTRETLQNEVLQNVKYGSAVYTDDAVAYDKLHWRYVHDVVNHAEQYVKGRVHTNGLENFWSLLKRHLRGTYVAVEPFHLQSYLDEQIFRFNNRGTKEEKISDADRFCLAVSSVIGRRLTYKNLTGKEGASETF